MNPVAEASATENPAATARGYRPAALALLTLALLALCVLLLLPFLPALAWGVALAVVANDTLAASLSRIFFTYYPQVFRTAVFTDEAVALAWLRANGPSAF